MFQFLIDILNDFLNFLKSRNIINAGVAFIIALQINKLFTDIINIIITPIVSKTISQEINHQENNFLGIDFKTGQLFLSTLNFVLVMIFIYYIFKLSETAPTFLDTVYSSVSRLFGKK